LSAAQNARLAGGRHSGAFYAAGKEKECAEKVGKYIII